MHRWVLWKLMVILSISFLLPRSGGVFSMKFDIYLEMSVDKLVLLSFSKALSNRCLQINKEWSIQSSNALIISVGLLSHESPSHRAISECSRTPSKEKSVPHRRFDHSYQWVRIDAYRKSFCSTSSISRLYDVWARGKVQNRCRQHLGTRSTPVRHLGTRSAPSYLWHICFFILGAALPRD